MATRRSRRGAALVARIAVGTILLGSCAGTDTSVVDRTAVTVSTPTSAAGAADADSGKASAGGKSAASGKPPSTTSTTVAKPAGPPSDQRTLTKVKVITGQLTPKSVVADDHGRIFAQNMVYSHTVNVYDRTFARVGQISDSVDLAEFGHPGQHQGGPVEAALSADGTHMYVTNYQMYGAGFTHPGNDKCAKGNWDPSYVYRVDIASLVIDQIIQVGAVPKYVATSPDGKWVFNSNWCGYDLSVIDAATGKEVRTVPLGRFPRGIAVTADSRFAYVAVMGSSDIAKVDLKTFGVAWLRNVGRGPRHLVLSPDGRYLYATLNSEGKVAKIDTSTDTVVAKVSVGSEPRSMDISSDGTALYVVVYAAEHMTKLATSDLHVLQTVPTNHHPIGITYDDGTDQVWVACYSGSLMVFDDR